MCCQNERIELEKDYSKFLTSEAIHSPYFCEIFVDTSQLHCESVVNKLKTIKLVEGKWLVLRVTLEIVE